MNVVFKFKVAEENFLVSGGHYLHKLIYTHLMTHLHSLQILNDPKTHLQSCQNITATMDNEWDIK